MIFDTALKLGLAPILLVQALVVRRRALVLPEARGPRSGQVGQGTPLRLLIVGDSSAAGVGAQTQSNALAGHLAQALGQTFSVSWTLRAKTGATTASTRAGLRSDPPGAADVIVMALGVNDVTRAVPTWLWLKRQKALHAWLFAQTGARLLYVSGMPPMGRFPLLPQPLRWVLGRAAARYETAMQRALCREERAIHVPLVFDLDEAHMAADGFHPGPAIYEEWGTKMASRIVSDWPKSHTARGPTGAQTPR